MGEATVGRVAREARVGVWTIRFYEKAGLLPQPKRSPSGYRIYGPEAAQRVQFVKRAQRLGLRLTEIREILELSDRGSCPCGHVRQVLKAKLAELAQKISDLNTVRSQIRTALNRSRRSTVRPTGKAFCPTIMGRTEDKKPKEA